MATADGTTVGSSAPSEALLDRMPVCFLVTGALIAGLILIGLAMDAGTSLNRQNAYVLLTFPASLLFQIFINRRPIRAL